jgi:inhibitor of cysteine peptidase
MANWTLTAERTGTTIVVSLHDTLTVVLEENPTTGYRWALDIASAEFFEILKSDFVPSPGGAVGRGGTRSISLGCKKAGRGLLQLKLKRAWSGEASGAQPFRVEVDVKA